MEESVDRAMLVEDHVLPDAQQRQNIIVFVLTNGLVYLCAPVTYIGITQASLCNALGSSDLVANLPSSAAFWGVVIPIFLAWRFHTVAALRPTLIAGYATLAVASLMVAGVLYWPTSATVRLTAIVCHGALVGSALAVINAFLWEMVGRGLNQRRQGLAYALAFGIGPILAVIGSLGAQLILSGKLEAPIPFIGGGYTLQWNLAPLAFPLNFAALFAASSLILVACTAAAAFYVVPSPSQELPRTAFLSGVTTSVRELFSDRVLVIAVLAFLLVDAGGTITNNLSLYTSTALGKAPEAFAGYQNALRFLFKMVAGVVLGWAVARTQAKSCLLITSVLCVCGALWPLVTPHSWFLVSFGLMGAGELYGIYYPNYIMNRSQTNRIRQNMAIVQLLTLATSLAPPAFGAISDRISLPASFVAACCVISVSIGLVAFGLPRGMMSTLRPNIGADAP